MIKVLEYIWNTNIGFSKVKYLVFGALFQVFKRVTKSVVSKIIFNGKQIFMYPNCNVSSMYAYTDIPDRREILLLRGLANDKAGIGRTVFMDIGANVGTYSISMMDVCDVVVAFEPHPFTSKRCKMNFLLNNISETYVKQLALSNTTGRISFSDYGGSSTVNHIVSNGGIDVEVTTLDEFIKKDSLGVDDSYILKVDVEGFEQQVFEGGKNFLSNYHIQGIIFECFSQGEVFETLRSYGFASIEKISENNYFATKN